MYLAFFSAKLMWFIAEFKLSGNFNLDVYIGDFDIDSAQYQIYNKLGYASYTTICIFASYFLESLYKHSKFILTALNILFATILIILPFGTGDIIFIFTLFLNSGLLLLITYRITKNSKYELRSLAALLIFGMIFIVFGMLLGNRNVKEYNMLPLWVSPSFTIGGIFIAISPMLASPEHYEKYSRYWVMIGTFLVIASWSFVFILCFTGGLNEFMFVFIAANVCITLVFLSLMSIVMRKKTLDDHIAELDILEVFKRPRRISEEEVSISKEKKICLVCKSKVGGVIFMCNECGAFYCKKCADSLVQIENICWNCESPIDGKKPTKKYEDLTKQEDLKTIKKKPNGEIPTRKDP